ncbi:major facilitator superfamily domain-containing protein [Russula vinacea]|nr:major facilitator superfamily domain-containing protein [Russula vinacea]
MGLFSVTSNEKRQISIDSHYLDTGAQLDASLSTQLDPGESLKIRRKIDRHVLPLMCILYCIQFMDKATLASSSILGILKATHLTANQYNWLGTIFYLGYLAFQFPQNLALQRFPVGKWMSLNIFIWGVALCSHAACKSFAGLFAVRLILGICEGSITAGFMIVSSMFYTRREYTARVGYCSNGWNWSNYHRYCQLWLLAHTYHKLEPWQWYEQVQHITKALTSFRLMIITGTLTLITALSFFFLFPDSPTNAWFLTEGERAKSIRRIKKTKRELRTSTSKKNR